MSHMEYKKIPKPKTRIIRNSSKAIYMQNAIMEFVNNVQKFGYDNVLADLTIKRDSNDDTGTKYIGFSYYELFLDFSDIIIRYSTYGVPMNTYYVCDT